MSAVTEVASRLQTLGVGTAGTDLFYDKLPMSPDNCLAVRQVGGRGPERTMGASGSSPVLDYHTINILVRNLTYSGAETKLNAVLGALDWFSGTIGSIRYHLISLAYTPVSMGEDENKRVVFSATFDVIKQRS